MPVEVIAAERHVKSILLAPEKAVTPVFLAAYGSPTFVAAEGLFWTHHGAEAACTEHHKEHITELRENAAEYPWLPVIPEVLNFEEEAVTDEALGRLEEHPFRMFGRPVRMWHADVIVWDYWVYEYAPLP